LVDVAGLAREHALGHGVVPFAHVVVGAVRCRRVARARLLADTGDRLPLAVRVGIARRRLGVAILALLAAVLVLPRPFAHLLLEACALVLGEAALFVASVPDWVPHALAAVSLASFGDSVQEHALLAALIAQEDNVGAEAALVEGQAALLEGLHGGRLVQEGAGTAANSGELVPHAAGVLRPIAGVLIEVHKVAAVDAGSITLGIAVFVGLALLGV